MMLKMFCMYDRKSETYQPPLYCHNVGHALRVFGNLFAEPGQMMYRYPDDFQIFEIGRFDDLTAEVVATKPHLVCTGTELRAEYAPKMPVPVGDSVS